MEEQENSGISQGGSSLSLGMPVIQMGALLHPADLTDARARAVDVALALTVMQSDVALLRAEVTVLKVSVITALEHLAQMRKEHSAAIAETQNVITAAQDKLTSLVDAFDRRLTISDFQRGLEIDRTTRFLTDEIRSIPDTYLWNRFRAWLRRLLRRRD